jgi:uncharacterized membrane protein (UPF0182 family)
MIARSDGEHYGKLAVFQFPKQTVVFGPRQVVARINQDQAIAPQITLWNQQGSKVIQGTLLVIPIEESLLYIRPLYLRASGGQIPELNRVIVAYQDRIVMADTLTQALDRIFPRDGEPPPPEDDAARLAAALLAAQPKTGTPGQPGAPAAPAGPAVTPGSTPGPTPAAPPVLPSTPLGSTAIRTLVQQAEDHYRRAMDAQRAGDWAQYGEQIRRLGEVLAQLREAERRAAAAPR